MIEIFAGESKWLVRNHIVRKLQTERSLPVFPDILRNLDQLLLDPESNSTRVVSLLNSDPVILGRVLKLANSALYSSGRNEVHDIHLAVQRLGFHTIRNLVYSAKLPDLFDELPPDLHLKFWQHSQTVALLSKNLMLQRDSKSAKLADLSYLTGLMHDVGILIYLVLFPVEYTELASSCMTEGKTLCELEVEHMGIDHGELGAMYVQKHWGLPRELVSAIASHHCSPTRDDSFAALSNSVYAANVICNIYNHSNGFSHHAASDHLSLLQSIVDLGYDSKKLEMLLDMAEESVSAITGMLTN